MKNQTHVCDKCDRGLGLLEFPKYFIKSFGRVELPVDVNLGDIPQYEDVTVEGLCLVPTEVTQYFDKIDAKIATLDYKGFKYQAHKLNGEVKKLKVREDTDPKTFIENSLNDYFATLERYVGLEVPRTILLPMFPDANEFSSGKFGENSQYFDIPKTHLALYLEEFIEDSGLRRVDMSITIPQAWGSGISSFNKVSPVGILTYEGRLNS